MSDSQPVGRMGDHPAPTEGSFPWPECEIHPRVSVVLFPPGMGHCMVCGYAFPVDPEDVPPVPVDPRLGPPGNVIPPDPSTYKVSKV